MLTLLFIIENIDLNFILYFSNLQNRETLKYMSEMDFDYFDVIQSKLAVCDQDFPNAEPILSNYLSSSDISQKSKLFFCHLSYLLISLIVIILRCILSNFNIMLTLFDFFKVTLVKVLQRLSLQIQILSILNQQQQQQKRHQIFLNQNQILKKLAVLSQF